MVNIYDEEGRLMCKRYIVYFKEKKGDMKVYHKKGYLSEKCLEPRKEI